MRLEVAHVHLAYRARIFCLGAFLLSQVSYWVMKHIESQPRAKKHLAYQENIWATKHQCEMWASSATYLARIKFVV